MTDSDRQQRPAVWLASVYIYSYKYHTWSIAHTNEKTTCNISTFIKNRICHCRTISKLKGNSENNHFKKSHIQIVCLKSRCWMTRTWLCYILHKKHFQILKGEEWFCAVSDVILLPEFWQTHTPFCSVCERVNDERIQSDSRSDTWHTNTHTARVTRLTADKMRATYRRENHPHDAKMDRMTADE